MAFRNRSESTKKNQEPKNPKKLKPYHISFYRSTELVLGSSPMYITGRLALSGDMAEASVKDEENTLKIFGGVDVVIIRSWRATSDEFVYHTRLSRKRFYIDSKAGNYVVRYVRKNPNCLECGAPNITSASYCTKVCRRNKKNRRQLETLKERIAKAVVPNPCKKCTIRPCEGNTSSCNNCRSYKNVSRRAHLKTYNRLYKQIPQALALFAAVALDACDIYKYTGYKGERFPRGGKPTKRSPNRGVCKSCLQIWLTKQVPVFSELAKEFVKC